MTRQRRIPDWLNARSRALALSLLWVVVGALLTPRPAAAEPQAGAVLTTPQFAFYSDLRVNLHDTLLLANRADGLLTDEEQACIEGLAPSAAAGWRATRTYYQNIVAPHQWRDRQQFLLRLALQGRGDPDGDDQQYIDIVAGLLAAATPAYRACLWPAHNQRNRQWVAGLAASLENHESAIASRLESLYAVPWHGLPLRVDVVPNAPPRGANSIVLSPRGGHIYVSSRIPAHQALEIVFHEASHTVTAPWRPDPLPAALEAAAGKLDTTVPRDLWHVVLFYVTGSVLRDQLTLTGNVSYTMYMEERQLWNGRWAPYRHAIEAVVPRYLDGSLSLNTMAELLVKQLKVEQTQAR